MHIKDITLAPIYLYQARKLKRNAIELPEAEGERDGIIKLSNQSFSKHPPSTQPPSALSDNKPALKVVLTGDSSAAGVGVNHQEEALLGHMLDKLKDMPDVYQHYSEIDWALHATKGHTSFDILRRLYVLPTPSAPVDIMLILVGVNDVAGGTRLQDWKSQLTEIITLSKRKFGARHIVFPYLPPMAHMPSIPAPLSGFIGAKSDVMNDCLQQISDSFDDVSTVEVDFSDIGLTAIELFSEDGFHPNTMAYEFWANKISLHIQTLL